MDTKIYYSPKGKSHRVSTDYRAGGYIVILDGKLYASADDRAELNEVVRELVKRKRFTETPKSQKITPLMRASK